MTTPATDPLIEYDNAQRRRDQATNKCDRLREIVMKAADALRDWRVAAVSNINIPLPSSTRTSIDAKTWPTAQQIAETLAEFHAADHALDSAIRRLPKSMQDRLTP